MSQFRLGIAFAVGSAVTFGMSGPFAKALIAAGWTPNAAVVARLAGGAAVLAVACAVWHRTALREALANRWTVLVYGLGPIAGAQLCYYNAASHLSVAVALLLEYLAPVLVVAWVWGRTRRRPGGRTLAGAAMALTGTLGVLGVFSGSRIDSDVDTVGVCWALAAAVCAACYFVLSDRVAADGNGLSALTLSAGGLCVGTVAVAVLGIIGVLPLRFTAHDTVVAGHATSVWLPIVVLAVVSTALAYVLGISGVARLRPSYASLLGLAEVVCAVLAAWVLLGESISAVQAAGGAVVLLGLALAGSSGTPPADLVAAATSPDTPRKPRAPGKRLAFAGRSM